jgi:hypothetical protein
MAWTDPTTRATGFVVTAAVWNADVVNNLKEIGDAWTAYTPAWTASTTNPTIGNGTIVGRWISAGKMVLFKIQVTIGTTTTLGTGNYSITLPTAAHFRYETFSGTLRDVSASVTWPIMGEVNVSTKDDLIIRRFPTTAGNDFANTSGTAPVALASTDAITISGCYEAA